MPRHLGVPRPLLREPCGVDPSELPRVGGGFACADCGRTVVDVASLTLEQAVEFRRRAGGGAARVCGAYTLDGQDRVLLRGGSSSPGLIAIAVSALLAACETSRHESVPPPALAASSVLLPATIESAAPRITPSPSATPTGTIASADTPSATAAVHAVPSAEPRCIAARATGGKRPHGARAKEDPSTLAGY